MKNSLVVLALTIFMFGTQGVAQACENCEGGLKEACKAECPSAKNEHEAHKCMKAVVKAKKSDKEFKKSECFKALVAHEEHEKKDGHKH